MSFVVPPAVNRGQPEARLAPDPVVMTYLGSAQNLQSLSNLSSKSLQLHTRKEAIYRWSVCLTLLSTWRVYTFSPIL